MNYKNKIKQKVIFEYFAVLLFVIGLSYGYKFILYTYLIYFIKFMICIGVGYLILYSNLKNK